MTTLHTPGPWHMGIGNGIGSVFPETGRTRLEDGGTALYPIASVNSGWNAAEDAANGRLIVAAPAMLEALKIAEAALEAYSGGESSDLAIIRAAIAKAEKKEIARSEKKVDRKTAVEVEALRSALGNIEQALGLGHLRTDRGDA